MSGRRSDSEKLEVLREQLPDWLNNEIDNCDISGLTFSKTVISELLEKGKQNPLQELQASKIQMQSGDYKYILSLANYCFSNGWNKFRVENFQDSYKYFYQAAVLYQRDPRVGSSDWKNQRILECLLKCIEAVISEAVFNDKGISSYEKISGKAKPKLENLQKHLSIEEIEKQTLSSYYVVTINYLLSKGNLNNAYKIISKVVDSEIKNIIPKRQLSKYYDDLSNKNYKKKNPTLEELKVSANYKQKSLLISEELYNEAKTPNTHITLLERIIDFHKISSFIADFNANPNDYISNIDIAIENAVLFNNLYPSDIRQININYLQGTKYGTVSKYTNDFEEKANQLEKACFYLKQVGTTESNKSFIFYQLWHYFYKLYDLICIKNNFDAAIACARESLDSDWANQSETILPKYLIAENKGLHLGITLFHDTITKSDLGNLDTTIKWMREENARGVYVRVVSLIYGLQLIRFNGLNDPRIIGDIVLVIKSAISQLLVSGNVSFESTYDDVQLVKEKVNQSEMEKEILSKLRRRKTEENYELEVKQMMFEKNTKSVTPSLIETIIAFLNSLKGGNLFIGIEDDTYEIRGISEDLIIFGGSTDKFKQTLFNYINDYLEPTLSKTWLPKIEILFPEVEQKTIAWVKIPPGPYMDGLYIDVKGKACIKKDGRIQRVESPIEKDNYASQRRENKGLWAIESSSEIN